MEASSGSTAISEAYFARMLDLPFHTVIPATTSKEKIHKIEFLGGTCHLADTTDIYSEAQKLAEQLGGHYMDQFTYAEPTWIVLSAGTGGTSATIGRAIRYKQLSTKLCVADPEGSVFYDFFQSRDASLTSDVSSRIEGMQKEKQKGSVVSLICDSGDRYLDTYYNPEWLKKEGLDPKPYQEKLEQALQTGLFQFD